MARNFSINTTPTDSFNSGPRVSMGSSGDFAVVWNNLIFLSPGIGVDATFARSFDETGAARGPQFQVNTYTPGATSAPAVAVGPTGDFLVSWTGCEHPAVDGCHVFAQRFMGVGARIGREFLVDASTTAPPAQDGSIALDPSGNFVVTFASQDGDNLGVFGRQGMNSAAQGLSVDRHGNATTSSNSNGV